MTLHIRDAGVVKPVKKVFIKDVLGVGPVDQIWVKDAGTWKRAFRRGTTYVLTAGVSSAEYGAVRWGYDVFNYPYVGSLTPSPTYNGFPIGSVSWMDYNGGRVGLLFRNTGYQWTEAQLDAIDWTVLEINGFAYKRASATRSPMSYGPGEPLQGLLYEWPGKRNPFVAGNTYDARIY